MKKSANALTFAGRVRAVGVTKYSPPSGKRQPAAQPLFEPSHGPGDRGDGYAHRRRGSSERAFLGDLRKHREPFKVG